MNYSRSSRFLTLTSVLLIFSISHSNAANKIWTGATNSLWSNSSNWTGGLPGSGDVAVFSSGSAACTIDGSVTINALNINGTYSGTITQSAGVNVTIGTGGYSQSTATFIGSSGAISITDANFSISGGTFTGGSGNITILGLRNSSKGFYIQTGGTFNAPTGILYLSSDWSHTSGGTFNHNNGTVYFRDYANCDSYLDINVTETFYNLTLLKNSTARGLAITSGDSVRVMGQLLLSKGWLLATTTTAAYLDAYNDVTVSSNLGTNKYVVLRFRGSNNQDFDLTGATNKFDCHMVLNKTGGELTLQSDLLMDFDYDNPSINPLVTLTSGTLNLNNKTLSSTYLITKGNVTINGDVTVNGPGTLTTAYMTQNSGEISFLESPTVNVNRDFIINNGIFNSTAGTLNVGLDWENTSGGTFNHDSGTVRLVFITHTSVSIDVNGCENFYNLELDKTYTSEAVLVASGDKIAVEGDLLLTTGYLENQGSGFFKVFGNVTVGSLYNPNNKAPLLFSGYNTQNFDLSANTSGFDADIWISKGGGEVKLLSNLTMNADDQDLIIGNGTLNLNGYALNVSGSNSSSSRYLNGVLTLNGGSASPTPTYIESTYTPPTDNCATPLPITLISFKAIEQGDGALIQWSTASETNNDFFTIEKSEDGRVFNPVAMINGAGNSSSILNYSHFDLEVLNQVTYYRLKQTDFDGQYEYSNVIAFIRNVKVVNHQLYPNPGREYVKAINQLPVDVTVRGFNLNGQSVFEYVVSARETMEIDLREMPRGLYTVYFDSPKGREVFQLVVNK